MLPVNFTLTIDALALQLASAPQTTFTDKYITQNYIFSGNAYQVTQDIQLRRTQKLEKYYLHCFAVWIDGFHVATLSTNCRQFGQAESIKLAFENEVFYTLPGFQHYLSILVKQMPLRVVNISYLELAYDFQAPTALLPQLSHLYRHSTFIKHNPEPEYGPFQSRLKLSVLCGSQYIFGDSTKKKGSTGKQVVVYSKTEELQASGKEYILNYYQRNGFDMTQGIERIEVRLSQKYLSKYLLYAEGLTIGVLENVFRVAVGDTFTFRRLKEVSYDANRNRKTAIVSLIEFSAFSGEALYEYRPYRERDESETRNRIEAKNTILRYITYGRTEDLMQLEYIRRHVQCPGGAEWSVLFRRYAQDYQGNPTPERMQRVELFG